MLWMIWEARLIVRDIAVAHLGLTRLSKRKAWLWALLVQGYSERLQRSHDFAGCWKAQWDLLLGKRKTWRRIHPCILRGSRSWCRSHGNLCCLELVDDERRVAIIGEGSCEWIASYLAVMNAGTCCGSNRQRTRGEEIKNLLGGQTAIRSSVHLNVPLA